MCTPLTSLVSNKGVNTANIHHILFKKKTCN
jgi:hypothetical protein